MDCMYKILEAKLLLLFGNIIIGTCLYLGPLWINVPLYN